MLARGYGADVVYSEELIDHKLMRCERIVEDFAPPAPEDDDAIPPEWARPQQLVRFAMKTADKGALHGKPSAPPRNVFITYPGEPVALQLGTASAVSQRHLPPYFSATFRPFCAVFSPLFRGFRLPGAKTERTGERWRKMGEIWGRNGREIAGLSSVGGSAGRERCVDLLLPALRQRRPGNASPHCLQV